MLSATRDADAAERFFRKGLQASHRLTPRVITVDQNDASPPAFEALQQEGMLPASCALRQCKYLNNAVEQDHPTLFSYSNQFLQHDLPFKPHHGYTREKGGETVHEQTA
jgi:transposase-like protein